MYIFELESRDLETPYYDPAEDKYGTRNLSSTRKTKITLKDLNRLKRIRSIEELERIKREELFSIMYGTPAEEGGAGGGIGF
jgi:hypothetical protein